MPPLPTFLVIGAMKAGTSSLWSYLRAHPSVFMPEHKELNFFVAEKEWPRGVDWYRDQFRGAEHHVAIGEASPDYTKADIFGGVPARIATVIPDVRLVYVVREPVARMRSMYLHMLSRGEIAGDAVEVLLTNTHLFASSRYAWQVEHYLEHVDRSQVLLITSEDLRDHRAATVAQVYEFLGVDPTFVPPNLAEERHGGADRRMPRRLAAGLARRPAVRSAAALLPGAVRHRLALAGTRPLAGTAELPPEAEAELRARFRDDVLRLRELMGPSFDGWGIA